MATQTRIATSSRDERSFGSSTVYVVYCWCVLNWVATHKAENQKAKKVSLALLPTYLHGMLAHIGLNARWGKLCFLLCVTAIKCDDISVCHSDSGNRQLRYFSCSSPRLQMVALLAHFISLLQSKSQGVHLSDRNKVYNKAKEETMPFNTVTQDTSWNLLKVRGRAASVTLTPPRLPSPLYLMKQCYFCRQVSRIVFSWRVPPKMILAGRFQVYLILKTLWDSKRFKQSQGTHELTQAEKEAYRRKIDSTSQI